LGGEKKKKTVGAHFRKKESPRDVGKSSVTPKEKSGFCGIPRPDLPGPKKKEKKGGERRRGSTNPTKRVFPTKKKGIKGQGGKGKKNCFFETKGGEGRGRNKFPPPRKKRKPHSQWNGKERGGASKLEGVAPRPLENSNLVKKRNRGQGNLLLKR